MRLLQCHVWNCRLHNCTHRASNSVRHFETGMFSQSHLVLAPLRTWARIRLVSHMCTCLAFGKPRAHRTGKQCARQIHGTFINYDYYGWPDDANTRAAFHLFGYATRVWCACWFMIAIVVARIHHKGTDAATASWLRSLCAVFDFCFPKLSRFRPHSLRTCSTHAVYTKK